MNKPFGLVLMTITISLQFQVSGFFKTNINSTVPPTLTPTVVPVPNPPTSQNSPQNFTNASVPDYNELIEVQKSVLETTRSTITVTLSTITLLLAGISLLGTIGGITAYRRISDAADRADRATGLINEIEEKAKTLSTVTDESSKNLSLMKSDIEKLQREFHQTYIDAKRDIQSLKSSLLLVQLEEHSIDLFSDDQNAKWKAIQALSSMTNEGYKAFVRKRSVMILGQYALDSGDQEILKLLQNVSQNDPAKSVRKYAEDALEEFRKQTL